MTVVFRTFTLRAVSVGLLFLATLFVQAANAHSLGESYIWLDVYKNRIDVMLEARFEELKLALPLDANSDGLVSDAEADANIDKLRQYAQERFGISADGNPYALDFVSHSVLDEAKGRFLQMRFSTGEVEAVPTELDVEYRLLFDADPQHRALLLINRNDIAGTIDKKETVVLVFKSDRTDQPLLLTGQSVWARIATFIGQGIHHILIGYDHILFLIALILPAVLMRNAHGWQPVASFKPALMRIIKIVTLFTLAHSITLSLAALGLVQMPDRVVESIIAASVLLAAINNIYPYFKRWEWLIIFGFGLFHGMGFASVLGHLITDQRNLVTALLGFNIGVELGQLLIVCSVFPVLYFLRERKLYTRFILQAGSTVISVFALLWFSQRAFGF